MGCGQARREESKKRYPHQLHWMWISISRVKDAQLQLSRQFSGQARNSISRYLSYSTLHTSSSLSRTMHVPQSNGPQPSHSINHHRVWYVMYVLRQQLTLLWSTLIYSATQPAARGGILRVVLISDGYKDESTNPRWRRHLFNCN